MRLQRPRVLGVEFAQRHFVTWTWNGWNGFVVCFERVLVRQARGFDFAITGSSRSLLLAFGLVIWRLDLMSGVCVVIICFALCAPTVLPRALMQFDHSSTRSS